MAESPPQSPNRVSTSASTSTGNYYDQFQSTSPRVKSATRLSLASAELFNNSANQIPATNPNAPIAPPITADLSKQLSPSNSNTITEIKSESALVRRQRMAGEALKQLQAMHVHLGFSFDAVEEHGNNNTHIWDYRYIYIGTRLINFILYINDSLLFCR